jgi:2'-5' RNA ligase
MSNTIRAFIAIELPETVIDSIKNVQNHLISAGIKLRWIQPENIHLTLKFLGNITTEDIERIRRAAFVAAMGLRPFFLEAKGLGVFPDIHRPRVVWVGISGQTSALIEMQKALEESLNQIGFPKETRPFREHLTVGRVKWKIDSKKVLIALNRYKTCISDPFAVKHFFLFKSDLKATGAVYTKLIQVPL